MAERSFAEICEAVARHPREAVARAEAAYRARVEEVAQTVLARGCHVVLLAGPSASGKTTTANLVKDALIARGKPCEVISLDHFYLESTDPNYPRLPNGERDMECVEALDLPLFRKTAEDIVKGRPFAVPHYDFAGGSRIAPYTHYAPVGEGCVIFEGLHALNPAMSDSLPNSGVLKLFISVSTNLNGEGGERLISGKRIRFVRRLVRDSIYRGATAADTLRVFASVVAGEDKYLYPFRGRADICFDTFHEYELAVMKPYAEKLLTTEVRRDPYASRVTAALDAISELPESVVPQDSLIREFIPGGIYENIY